LHSQGNVTILEDININIKEEEFVSILGPSGSALDILTAENSKRDLLELWTEKKFLQ
jgi:ABC-type transporter Mla maintaining outer membrane lipid asymmetry ATPase subunit MlaF